jgi:hypothetical protein
LGVLTFPLSIEEQLSRFSRAAKLQHYDSGISKALMPLKISEYRQQNIKFCRRVLSTSEFG